MPFLYRPFDPKEPRNVVLYTRMSSDQQNKRSPDQQDAMVKEILRRMQYPWKITKRYTDSGKSARRVRNRPQYNQMISELKAGLVDAKFVLVDTIERFGRTDNLDSLRRDLYQRHGIVVLSADRYFDDPNSPQGRAATMMESFRAGEDSRIKRHNVIRGKRDAIQQGFWPGGPVPFGYSLEVAATEHRGGREIKHHILVPDKITFPIVRSTFVKSIRNPSMGQESLAKWLSGRSDIPGEFRPFHSDTVGRWLKNSIYYGELVWGENSSGIVDDVRVLERNPDDEILRVTEFCDPIVSRDEFNEVAAGRKARRTNGGGGKNKSSRIGMVYKYVLTGLVRCAHCKSSMVPNGSGAYTTANGEERRYTAYMCPKSRTDCCANNVRVNEEWLRDAVISKLRNHLFPVAADTQLPWLDEITALVEAELNRKREDAEVCQPALLAEKAQLEQQVAGWSMSLAKPDLAPRLREQIETDYGTALERVGAIEALLHREAAENRLARDIVDPQKVQSGLASLSQVLANHCPSTANLMLSMHIDRIDVYKSSRIEVRICKLGSCPDIISWFGGQTDSDGDSSTDPAVTSPTLPRRRTKVCADIVEEQTPALREIAELATDPNRFAGMPDSWFWIEDLTMPQNSCWSRDNAQRVLGRYKQLESETGRKPSGNLLAAEFGVSRPTILAALDVAQNNCNKRLEHRRRPTVKVKGNREVESRIEEMHDTGSLEKDIAEEIGVSRSTITLALDRLYKKRGLPKPDGRATRHQHGPSEDSIYVLHAAKAFELWNSGKSLRAIGKELGICDLTAKQAVSYWCKQHDLPEPTVEARRQQWIDQAVAAIRSGIPLVNVARQLKKSTATIRLWVKESDANRGEQRADTGRTTPV